MQHASGCNAMMLDTIAPTEVGAIKIMSLDPAIDEESPG